MIRQPPTPHAPTLTPRRSPATIVAPAASVTVSPAPARVASATAASPSLALPLPRPGSLRWLLVLTNGLAMLGFLVLTQLPAAGGYSPVLVAVIFVGFGTAGTAFGAMVTASRGVADDDQGLVGGVINTSRQIGAGIGAALLPAIALTVSHGTGTGTAGVGGARAAMLAGAVAAGLATLVAWRSQGDDKKSTATTGRQS